MSKQSLADSNLSEFLCASVPLYIRELLAQDGPTDYQVEQAKKRGVADADIMLFGGAPGEAAALANTLAEVVAILAFAPGGIHILGQHFEADKWKKLVPTADTPSR